MHFKNPAKFTEDQIVKHAAMEDQERAPTTAAMA